MTKQTKNILDVPAPEEEVLETKSQKEIDEHLAEQTEVALASEIIEKSASDKDREIVHFILQEQPNDRFKNPLPMRVNGAKIDIHRGIETYAPRFIVAGTERKYIPAQMSGRHPMTGQPLKRKVEARMYETVTLIPNPKTGKIDKIDLERQKALREEQKKWRDAALKRAVVNQ